MNRTINRMMLIFLGVFLISAAVVVVYQYVWVIPGQTCESSGDWWDWRQRTCAHPVLISDITGRVIINDKALAAAKAETGSEKKP